MQGDSELVVGVGVRIVGSIVAPGRVRLLGCVEGDLQARDVIVAATGELLGALTAERIEICGHVAHAVTGTEAVVIRGSALVEGELAYAALEIEAGARVHVNLRRIVAQPGVEVPAVEAVR